MAETREAEATGFTVSSSACQHYFGFLSQRPKGTPIPEECLTCEKMLDCLVSKPDLAAAKLETKTELNVAKQAETAVTFEEVTVTEPLKTLRFEPEKKVEPSLRQQIRKHFEPEKPAEKSTQKSSDDDFCVENQGVLCAQWSSTVLMNRETLQLLGKNVKEVEVQTHRGKKTRCKVYAVPDMKPRAIQIPSKIKADLEIDNGYFVRVKPVQKITGQRMLSLRNLHR
jgi:hypothetical protein